MKSYLPRRIEGVLRRSVRRFPCCILTGPRQAGKSTLARHCLKESHSYVSLDEPDVRALALSDPRLFLENNPPPVIIDEIQYVPDLLAYIKHRVDADRSRMGQYVLTGSQNFSLMAGVGESLAGRTAVLTLLPMSWGERCQVPAKSGPDRPKISDCKPSLSAMNIAEGLLRGGFPESVVSVRRNPRLWYAGYVQTYLERDVRQIRNIGDYDEFQRFLRAAAARNGQIFNMAEMSRDLGVALNTVKSWISLLVASHQIILLRPYFRNLGKRLVKNPKIYFLDSGLVCYLTGVQTPLQCAHGPQAGSLLEADVISEVLKWFYNHGEQPALYAWRTSAGQEVDCVIESGGNLWPLEIKLTATVKPDHIKGLAQFMELFPEARRGRLIYLGANVRRMAPAIEAAPFSWLASW